MKVIVGSFQYEACGFSGMPPGENDFEYFKGEEIYRKLAVKDLFEQAGIEDIPAIYANALPGGKLPAPLYFRYLNELLETVRQNADADGIFLYCHGSMEVEGIGSGELRLLREIRNIAGARPLVALALDLHANVTDELQEYADIVCGYKTAPHTDQAETQRRAVRCLIRHLQAGTRPQTVSIALPMLPMGDAMLTGEEPLKGLIAETREIERGGQAVVNLFFGHMWVDAPNTHASVVVTADDGKLAAELAKDFAKRFWATRREYRLKVENGPLEEGVSRALKAEEGRFFLSDSGDNTTAGAAGDRLDVAQAFLERGRGSAKRICVAGITCEALVSQCRRLAQGAAVPLSVNGKVYPATIAAKGKILGWAKEIIGDSVALRVDNVDLIFTERRSAFIDRENFETAGLELSYYQVVAVKLGYLFSGLLPWCDRHYFALTEGGSCVDMRRHRYERLRRPMFPLDDDAEYEG